MTNRPRLTYANVVSTLALFLAFGGSAAFAATKIRSAELAPGAVHTSNVFKRAITSGKIALGAVRSNQIAEGAVGATQIGDGAIGSKQVGAAAIAPSNLQFPVFYAASPMGGPVPVSGGQDPYPVAPSSWTQSPGQIEVIFGAARGTLAYDESSNQGSCRVFFEVGLNGQQVGGGEISTASTSPQTVEQSIGAQPRIDPVTTITNHLTIGTASNGGCAAGSTIDSARFRVLDFG
jgi:hypothetical protein